MVGVNKTIVTMKEIGFKVTVTDDGVSIHYNISFFRCLW